MVSPPIEGSTSPRFFPPTVAVSRFAILAVLLSLSLSLLLGSCATTPTVSSPTAPMDLALDTAGGRMFYKGSAAIPRNFNSPTSFKLEINLAHWGNPAANETGTHAQAALGNNYEETGVYQPLANGEGLISLAAGRLLLRGKVLDDGQELDGRWFFDGKYGGGFRLARKGYLFP